MKKKIFVLFLIIIILVIFFYLQNNMIKITNNQLKLPNLPKGFDGYRIVQLSDLHEKNFGKDNSILISKIKKAKPDLIVITGDLIDATHFNEENTIKFLNKIKQIAPVYYVTGNHEQRSNRFLSLDKKINNNNITLLRNSSITIEKNNDIINLAGIDDPISTRRTENSSNKKTLNEELEKTLSKDNKFTILLSHRPEQFSLYVNHNVDLIFSGHAHGGQIRLPLVGGFISPNQGFFPKYTSGIHSEKNSTMVVSRGLGNGTIPLRLFNRPEIVVVTLHKK